MKTTVLRRVNTYLKVNDMQHYVLASTPGPSRAMHAFMVYSVCTEHCDSWCEWFPPVCSICYQNHQSPSAWPVRSLIVSNYLALYSQCHYFLPIILASVRGCVGNEYFMPVSDPRSCSSQCSNPPICGLSQIPEEHLKVRIFSACDPV